LTSPGSVDLDEWDLGISETSPRFWDAQVHRPNIYWGIPVFLLSIRCRSLLSPKLLTNFDGHFLATSARIIQRRITGFHLEIRHRAELWAPIWGTEYPGGWAIFQRTFIQIPRPIKRKQPLRAKFDSHSHVTDGVFHPRR